jgi:thiamine pyrophosphate-dependent acetolactate synthase large subunit-like protein
MAARKAKAEELQRSAAVAAILKRRGDALVVTGIGNAVHDVAASGDVAENFYLSGIMGGAAMVGMGLALARPDRRVLVITGDGEMLAGIGSLATIGVEKAPNLAIVVIDNRAYAATGMQATHTARGVDLAGIAKASGFGHAVAVSDAAGLRAVVDDAYEKPGPYFAVLRVKSEGSPRVKVPADGTFTARRFRRALLGDEMNP